MRSILAKRGAYPARLLGDAASQVPAYQLLSEGMRFEARLAHDACDFDIDYVFEVVDCLEDFGIEELAFDLEPAAYIEEFRKQQFARSNRSMLPLPAALGRHSPNERRGRGS